MKELLSILLIGFLWSFNGCSQRIGPRVVDSIGGRNPSVDTCVVNMKEITEFAWDKMYCFSPSSEPSEIDSVLQSKMEDYRGGATLLVFLHQGQVVHHEQYDYEPSNHSNGYIYTDAIPMGYFEVTEEKAEILVIRHRSRNSIYYEFASTQLSRR